MSDRPPSLTRAPHGYAEWLAELKHRIHAAQQRATLAVNRERVLLRWQIGHDILARRAELGWGPRLSIGWPRTCAQPFRRCGTPARERCHTSITDDLRPGVPQP
jgi:hypothetical protein